MLFRRCQLFVGAFSRLRDYDGIVLIYNPHWHVAQATISKGHVYASGNIGCDKDFKIVEGGVQGQTVRSKFRYILACLK